MLLTQPQTCEKHRSLCVKMGEAMVKANVYMHDHPEEAMALLGKRLNVTDPTVLAEAYKAHARGHAALAGARPQALETADRLNIEAGFR